MGIKSYRDLDIWNKGMEIVKFVSKITEDFPKEEIYGLTAQLHRAAVSIPSNIAEGFRRFHRKEFKQYLHIALGSCAELETQITLANELSYLDKDVEKNCLELTDHFSRMTMNLIKKL